MFFKTKKKTSDNKASVFPKIQTAEGWKRMMLKKMRDMDKKKT